MTQFTFRWILYILNKLMTILALAWTIYCLIKLITNLDNWLEWLGLVAVGIALYLLSKVFFVIRKSYCPLAGRDYL